jgi:hypothetical protein
MLTVSRRGGTRHLFGNVALVLFLLTQVFDGALTYVGVTIHGAHIEGNPIVGWLMGTLGYGVGLATAKLTAGFFGIVLHLSSVHHVVAVLAAFYLTVAIVPWVAILFF